MASLTDWQRKFYIECCRIWQNCFSNLPFPTRRMLVGGTVGGLCCIITQTTPGWSSASSPSAPPLVPGRCREFTPRLPTTLIGSRQTLACDEKHEEIIPLLPSGFPFGDRMKSEILSLFSRNEKWFFLLFSRNEKWKDLLFHSWQVKVKFKCTEIEGWYLKKYQELSRRETLAGY